MRSLKLASLLAVAPAPALFADVCVPDTLTNYIALVDTGCSVGTFNVKDFSFSVLQTTLAISPSDIFVTPVESGETVGLIFDSPTKSSSRASTVRSTFSLAIFGIRERSVAPAK